MTWGHRLVVREFLRSCVLARAPEFDLPQVEQAVSLAESARRHGARFGPALQAGLALTRASRG